MAIKNQNLKIFFLESKVEMMYKILRICDPKHSKGKKLTKEKETGY